MQNVSRPLLAGAVAALSLACVLGVAAFAQEEHDLDDLANADGVRDRWIYDDIEAGYAAAQESGKPLLVAFR